MYAVLKHLGQFGVMGIADDSVLSITPTAGCPPEVLITALVTFCASKDPGDLDGHDAEAALPL